MSVTTELLERVRKHTATGSDYAVAQLLGISRFRMSHYMRGIHELDDDEVITRAAKLIGENPAALLARFQAAKSKSPEARGYWLKLERLALKSAAACLVLGAASMATTLPSRNIESTGVAADQANPTMYIMLSNAI